MKIQQKWAANIIEAFACLIVILSLVLLASPSFSRADAPEVSPFDPFGGIIGATVPNVPPPPALPTPNPVCPAYTLVTNADPTSNALPVEFGVFVPQIPPALSFDYNNFLTPGTPILGGLEPVPCVNLAAPAIQIFPIFYDFADGPPEFPGGPFYLDGTGGVPGTY